SSGTKVAPSTCTPPPSGGIFTYAERAPGCASTATDDCTPGVWGSRSSGRRRSVISIRPQAGSTLVERISTASVNGPPCRLHAGGQVRARAIVIPHRPRPQVQVRLRQCVDSGAAVEADHADAVALALVRVGGAEIVVNLLAERVVGRMRDGQRGRRDVAQDD